MTPNGLQGAAGYLILLSLYTAPVTCGEPLLAALELSTAVGCPCMHLYVGWSRNQATAQPRAVLHTLLAH